MISYKRLIIAIAVFSGLTQVTAWGAGIPLLIPHSGTVKDKATGEPLNLTGPGGHFKFAIINGHAECESSTGLCVTHWSNDDTSVNGQEPATAVTLLITNGVFSLKLGDTATLGDHMREIPADIFANPDTFLRVWFSPDGTAPFERFSPDRQFVTVPYAIRAKNGVPVGTVIDWWRPNASFPIPEGFQICDGSIVTNAISPLVGQTLPDLNGIFVRGTSNAASIGTRGGGDQHSHTTDLLHAHDTATSSASGQHIHSVDPPKLVSLINSRRAGAHNHVALRYLDPTKVWADGLGKPIIEWTNGIDGAGSGIFPLARETGTDSFDIETDIHVGHEHITDLSHDHPPSPSSIVSGHTHSVTLPSMGRNNKTSSLTKHLPPFVSLLKIIRIF